MLQVNEAFSDEHIRSHCPMCDRTTNTFTDPLEETEDFHIVCDAHCIREGHILIIPKIHVPCIGGYSRELFEAFLTLYEKTKNFVKDTYGSVVTFEHGVIGQTVYHSHIHLLPFEGSIQNIIPEGETYCKKLSSLDNLKDEFEKEKQYLFVSIEDNMWTVDTVLGAPRFFRDRFAEAENRAERGNWKEMHSDEKIMEEVKEENGRCQEKWREYKD